MTDRLSDGLDRLGFSAASATDILSKMDKYIKEIILFNSAYNLTNTSDYNEIAVNHILDSLSAAAEIKKLAETVASYVNSGGIKIGDIGSGGGFPGIPLAAAMPEYSFTLVERMDKRCAFLENAAAVLGLKNVTVLKTEAEQVPPETFDIATFRAFRPLDKKMTKTLLRLVRHNGFLAAYKARAASIQEEMSSISTVIPDYKTIPLSVPFLTESGTKDSRERNLVVIKKI